MLTKRKQSLFIAFFNLTITAEMEYKIYNQFAERSDNGLFYYGLFPYIYW